MVPASVAFAVYVQEGKQQRVADRDTYYYKVDCVKFDEQVPEFFFFDQTGMNHKVGGNAGDQEQYVPDYFPLVGRVI